MADMPRGLTGHIAVFEAKIAEHVAPYEEQILFLVTITGVVGW